MSSSSLFATTTTTNYTAATTVFDANHDDGSSLDFKDALIAVAGVTAFLIFLLVLRFGCNIAIDLCILCDPSAARNTWTDVASRLSCCCCCCFRMKTTIAPDDENQNQEMTAQQPDSTTATTTSSSVEERLLKGLSRKERNVVISSFIKGMPVEPKNLQDWKGRYDVESFCRDSEHGEDDANTSATPSCSICLHNIQVGDSAYVEPHCQHVFHLHCIIEWCCNSTRTTCPYCRQSIMTQSQVESGIRDLMMTGSSTTATAPQTNEEEGAGAAATQGTDDE